jgi:cell division protein FtsB
MKSDAGGKPSPPRHLSAVPVQRVHAAPGGASGSGSSSGSGSGRSARPPVKRRTRYTARAAVLLMVFCALVLALAYPLQQYVSQNSQLSQVQQQNDQETKLVAQLKQQIQDWQDPAYVEIQARERLHYVLPGETGLTLLGGVPGSGAADGALPSGGVGGAWYAQLWGSVTAANGPGQP